jgi:hypothetical protein
MFGELYYWMYQYLRKIKTNDTPSTNAYFLICLLQGFNIMTFTVVVAYFFKLNVAVNRNITIYLGLALTVTLFIVNFILLFARRNMIFAKYDAMKRERKIKGQIYFWLYFLLSFIIFFVSVANLVEPKY